MRRGFTQYLDEKITTVGGLTAYAHTRIYLHISMYTYIFSITIAGNELPAEYGPALVVVYHIKSGCFA